MLYTSTPPPTSAIVGCRRRLLEWAAIAYALLGYLPSICIYIKRKQSFIFLCRNECGISTDIGLSANFLVRVIRP